MSKRCEERWARTHDQMRQQVLVALRAGKSISQITGQMRRGKYITGIVAGNTLTILRSENADFDREVETLGSVNREKNQIDGRARSYANKLAATHCQRGHPITEANSIYFRKGYRQCRACKDMTDRAPGRPMTLDQARSVIAGLQEGLPLNLDGAGKRLVRWPRLAAFRQANPKFDQLVEKLAKKNRAEIHARAMVRRRVRCGVNEAHTAALIAEISAAVPTFIAERTDVIQSMWEALCERKLDRKDIGRRAAEFIKANNRLVPMFNKDVSLDRPLFEDSGMTLGDTVTRGLWG